MKKLMINLFQLSEYCRLSVAILALTAISSSAEILESPTDKDNVKLLEPKTLINSKRHLNSFPVSCKAEYDSSIPATANPISLQSIEEEYPGDEYVAWLESESGSSYVNSVYIPTSSNECKGMGFHWTILSNDNENGTIQIAAAVKLDSLSTKGWIAVGFSETGGMRGADVAYFTYNKLSDLANLVDAHILDMLEKPTRDLNQDWTLVDYTLSDDGYLILEAERDLVTNDIAFDRPFVDDSSVFVQDHKVIGAWGATDDVFYHGNNRVHTSIQLFEPKQGDVGSPEPGLFYDQFKREMRTRSEGKIDLNIESFNIPLQETTYHEECHDSLRNVGSSLYLIGYEFIIDPSVRKYVHHIIVYANAGNCGSSSLQRVPIFGWTPGDDFLYFPEYTGMKVGEEAGLRSFTLQYHFDNRDLDKDQVDSGSGVRLYYTKAAVKDEIGMMQVGDPYIGLEDQRIGDGLTRHTFTCPSSCTDQKFVSNEITIVKEQLHMHEFGERIVNQVVRGGVVVHESNIEYWDFDQIGTASPQKEAYKVMKGDEFRTICYYNSENDTKFGLGSKDEMCMAFILYFPKQPIETCSVNYFEPCRTKYEGQYNLGSGDELKRRFGNAEMSNRPCIDSSSYAFGTYLYDGKVTTVRNCDWLSNSSSTNNKNRRKNWCDAIVDGHRVSDKCPRACLTCADPFIEYTSIAPSPDSSVGPSIVSSSIPSIASSSIPSQNSVSPSKTASAQPTISPADRTSTQPSASASEYPTVLSTNNPTYFHSSQPSLEFSASPSKSSSPSLVPSLIPSNRPTIILSPSPSIVPSVPPTNLPTFSPTSSPTYSLQSLQLFIVIAFDSLNEFEGRARIIFEDEINTLIKTVLESKNGDDFEVFSSIRRFEVVKDSASRRMLFRSGYPRALQEIPPGLKVFLDIFVDVRSGTIFTTELLSEQIMTALDEESEREAFILALQTTDNETFEHINVVTKVTINNEEFVFPKTDSNNLIRNIIIAGGAGALAALIFGLVLIERRRRRSPSSKFGASRTQMSSPHDPRISSMIEINADPGEVSTIGDPLGTAVFTGMQAQSIQQQYVAALPQRSQPSQNYDYQRIYGGMGDSTQSLSTATEAMSASQQNDTTKEEKIVVVAPSGSLGVVIGNPKGFPTVHAIKETSPIIDMIQTGDKLLSVDGEDTTRMSAIRVSSLIGAKAMNPQRILVFGRPIEC